jgi:hypothetical protein
MGMEIARLSNASWFQIPDWQVVAIRAVWSSMDCSRLPSNTPTGAVPQRLPALDWPPALFEDERVTC